MLIMIGWAYSVDEIRALKLEDGSEITEDELIEMVKARDLKNQLFSEIQVKNGNPAKARSKI